MLVNDHLLQLWSCPVRAASARTWPLSVRNVLDQLGDLAPQDHHRGGVHMAAYAAQNAADPFVRGLAARMARNQRIEVGELQAARGRVGLPANPVGYEGAVVPTDHEGDG